MCKRCNYDSNKITHLRSHLTRKTICDPIDDTHNIPTKILLLELNMIIKEREKRNEVNRNFDCYCGKSYTNRSGLSRHRKFCDTAKKNTRTSMKQLINDVTEIKKILKKLNKFIQQNLSSRRVEDCYAISPSDTYLE